ncbi:MAG: sn-glycerol-3-phosphate ABC transporter ATP-binding protein UgpC [Gemmatimonadota bacterium]|nr:sn-glycerol-3-phosphate ABC transporter ATP-binding protein UgpC [Gemmatimonadota bacterium]
MAKVEFRNVWKTYPGDVDAVKEASFTIEDGEFMVIVGPSGCGKSTTLRMVAGLEDITRGEVSIDGRIVNDVAPKDRDIAMVFQNYALYPHMTVYDNMAFGLKMRKYDRSEIDSRVREAAEILGLTELLKRRPKALSGGQRQRVAVGRAIVRKPKVFLFDEPLSNLDAKLRVQMRTEISRLHQQLGATMMYVTHDQVEAMTMGTRITLMKDGVIQQIADPLSLYRRPTNRFVAGFIGSPAMNFLEGRVSRSDGGPRLSGAGFSVDLSGVPGLEDLPENLTVGIRPEDLELAERAEPASVEANVEVVEPLGSEILVHARAGSMELVARVAPDRAVSAGERRGFVLRGEALHVFDSASGEALHSPAGAEN